MVASEEGVALQGEQMEHPVPNGRGRAPGRPNACRCELATLVPRRSALERSVGRGTEVGRWLHVRRRLHLSYQTPGTSGGLLSAGAGDPSPGTAAPTFRTARPWVRQLPLRRVTDAPAPRPTCRPHPSNWMVSPRVSRPYLVANDLPRYFLGCGPSCWERSSRRGPHRRRRRPAGRG